MDQEVVVEDVVMMGVVEENISELTIRRETHIYGVGTSGSNHLPTFSSAPTLPSILVFVLW